MTEQPCALDSQTLGALPIVDRFLARMRVDALLGRVLPATDARVMLAPAKAIGLLVRNLCISREPIYALGEWAAPFDPLLLGLDAEKVARLGDDRVGRALEQLFDADRASLLKQLMLAVIAEFSVDCSQLPTTRHRSRAAAPTVQPTGISAPASRPQPPRMVTTTNTTRWGRICRLGRAERQIIRRNS